MKISLFLSTIRFQEQIYLVLEILIIYQLILLKDKNFGISTIFLLARFPR